MHNHAGQTPDYRRCCHVKINGARCTMPSLRDQEFCYEHHYRRVRARMKPRPPQWADHQVPLVTFVYMEDHASILSNLNAAADAFARHDIDYRQLNAITRLCETALLTLRQMKRIEEAITAEEVVRDAVELAPADLCATPAATSADDASPANAAPPSPAAPPQPPSFQSPAPHPSLTPLFPTPAQPSPISPFLPTPAHSETSNSPATAPGTTAAVSA